MNRLSRYTLLWIWNLEASRTELLQFLLETPSMFSFRQFAAAKFSCKTFLSLYYKRRLTKKFLFNSMIIEKLSGLGFVIFQIDYCDNMNGTETAVFHVKWQKLADYRTVLNIPFPMQCFVLDLRTYGDSRS